MCSKSGHAWIPKDIRPSIAKGCCHNPTMAELTAPPFMMDDVER